MDKNKTSVSSKSESVRVAELINLVPQEFVEELAADFFMEPLARKIWIMALMWSIRLGWFIATFFHVNMVK